MVKKITLKGCSQAKYLNNGSPSGYSMVMRSGKKQNPHIDYIRVGSQFSRFRDDKTVEIVKVTGFSKGYNNIPHIRYNYFMNARSSLSGNVENARSLSVSAFIKLFGYDKN